MSITIESHTKRRQSALKFQFIDVTEIAKTVDIHFPVAITRDAHGYHVLGPKDQFGETEEDRLWSIVVSLPGKGKTAPDTYLTPCKCYTVAPRPWNDERYQYSRAFLTAYFGPDENDELAFTIMMSEEAEVLHFGSKYGPYVVPLPESPKTQSPVPWLTSIHAVPGRGSFGDPLYPGNCSGKLICDLLSYYKPTAVLDPMSGSGTCSDVATDLEIPCNAQDLHSGFDATRKESFTGLGQFDFIWLHPPYWNLIRYSDDPRCLSNAPTLDVFLEALSSVIMNCQSVLAPGGVLGILIGDITRGGNHLGLPFLTYNVATGLGFKLAAPEIVRFSHGASSSRKSYAKSFIPRLHDVCLLLKC